MDLGSVLSSLGIYDMISTVFVCVYVRYVGNVSAGGSLGDLFCDFMKTLNKVYMLRSTDI